MSRLLKRLHPEISVYKDRRFDGDEADWERAMRTSTTVYVGNLSFYTREEQIYEVFSKVGHIVRVVMGLDKFNKTPCGFCFVKFYTRKAAESCVKYLNGTVLDERAIRVDHDWGFVEGRQWGRGRSGGQVRDEFRIDYDPGRGGFGKVVQKEIAAQRNSRSEYNSPIETDSKRRRVDSGRERRASYLEEENPRFREDRSDDEDR